MIVRIVQGIWNTGDFDNMGDQNTYRIFYQKLIFDTVKF